MSLIGTPVRKPLRELAANETRSITPSRCSHRTPKTSPGPALLLALKLSAKKQLVESTRLNFDEKENCDEGPKKDSGVTRFREILSSETERITGLCNKWDGMLSELNENNGPKPTDAILGDIRTTVGQGRLIMRERFHQFEGLVDNCEFGTSEKPVTCEDLQGFWDMIYFQVEDVDAKFNLLEKCKLSQWDAEVLKTSSAVNSNHQKKAIKKKRPVISKASSATSKARKEMLAEKRAEARKRLAAAKAEMKRLKQSNENEENVHDLTTSKDERVTFDAGFFKVDSPVKSPLGRTVTPSAANGTPRGTCLRKQVCTPGSITKSLATNSPLVHAKVTLSGLKTVKPEEEKANPIVSKKLEFAGAVQETSNGTECLVEILLTDPPSHGEDGTQISQTQTDTVVEALPMGDVKDNPNYENDLSAEAPNMNYSYTKLESVQKLDPGTCEIALSPPHAFADTEESKVDDETELLELGAATACVGNSISIITASTDIKPSPVLSGSLNKTHDVSANKETFEETDAHNPVNSTKHGEPVCQSKNETFEVQDAGDVTPFEGCVAQTGNKTFEMSDAGSDQNHGNVIGETKNLTFEIPESKSMGEKAVTKTCDDATSAKRQNRLSSAEQQDLDASNMSILIDEAARNIEKASEILKDTPHRETEKHRKPSNVKVKCVNDAATNVTPAVKANKRDDILLETLQKVACQMENLQKLNGVHLQMPSPLIRKETTMLKKLKQLQSEIVSLKDENSHLKISLDGMKTKQSNEDPSDAEKIMRLLFTTKDDGAEVSDSGYKPHYYRLLAKVKVLEAQLKAYDEVKSPLAELDEQLRTTWKKLEERTCSVEETSQKLEIWESALKEREKGDNEELLECRKSVKDLEAQLSDVQETWNTCEKERQQLSSALGALQVEHETVRNQGEVLKEEIASMKQENFSMDEKNADLEEKVERMSKIYADEHNRAEALDQKVKYLGQEIESAFTKFAANVQERDELISSQQKQIEDLNLANTKLRQDCQALQDRIETLEYVEDETRSLQEQLAETEVILKDSNANLTEKDCIIKEMNKEIDCLNQQIEDKNLEVANLQEELDVAKSEAHFMVQQREEELNYGKAGLDQILNKMTELNSTLQKKISEENTQGSIIQKAGEPGISSTTSLETLKVKDAACDVEQSPTTGIGVSRSLSQFHSSKCPNQDSIIWRVDDGAESLQSIIDLCLNLEVKFQKEINSVNLKNAVLQKQLATSKEKLSDRNREENELEQVLRKRIEKLFKENEEKSAKLECNSRTMKMLSDQNLELTNYMMKYEKLTGNPKTSRRSRSAKRRSSSAGSLKFLP